MLGEAVAEARGEIKDPEPVELTINLPADFYLPEEYLTDVDRRVMAYRRLAAASELVDIDLLERELEEGYGALPAAGKNLLDRARIRIRAGRLGVTAVSLASGRIVYLGLDVPKEKAFKLKEKGAIVYPKTHKLSYPYRSGGEDLIAAALGVLEELGGDDE